jgi:hypothetical protein
MSRLIFRISSSILINARTEDIAKHTQKRLEDREQAEEMNKDSKTQGVSRDYLEPSGFFTNWNLHA